MSKLLKARKIVFTAIEQNGSQYTFDGVEYENGVVQIPAENTNDSFYVNSEAVEANGNAQVTTYKRGEFVEVERDYLIEAIDGSAAEFGVDAVPAEALDLVNGNI